MVAVQRFTRAVPESKSHGNEFGDRVKRRVAGSTVCVLISAMTPTSHAQSDPSSRDPKNQVDLVIGGTETSGVGLQTGAVSS
jgi:hypothetical protein